MMMVRSKTLVVIPREKTLRELITIIKDTYDPPFVLPDRFGLTGMQAIILRDSVGEASSTCLTLRSMTASSYLSIFNLTLLQALAVCKELTGRLPSPEPIKNHLLFQLNDTMASNDKIC